MAKLIVEENLKSKHSDSFKHLKSHGYKLIDKRDGEVYRNPNTGHKVVIANNGTWVLGHTDDRVHHTGKSHSDLSVILKKVHD